MREGTRIRDRIRNRLSVREQAPMGGREMVGFLALSVLFALPAGLGLWQQSAFVTMRFSIEALRREKIALQERYRCLRIEQGTLESLGRVAEEASRSGLAPPSGSAPPIVARPARGGAFSEVARAGRDRRSGRTPDSIRTPGLAPGPAAGPEPPL